MRAAKLCQVKALDFVLGYPTAPIFRHGGFRCVADGSPSSHATPILE
jgi:hypothetical protein